MRSQSIRGRLREVLSEMTTRQIHAVAAIFIAAFVVVGCAGPTDDTVSTDFASIVEQETGSVATATITTQSVGEGDSDNVYVHVRFTLHVQRDAMPETGWLAGVPVSRGQQLRDGEIVLRYQKADSSQWELKESETIRKPGK